MIVLWGSIVGLVVYLEIIYHFSSFGLVGLNPIMLFMLSVALAGIFTAVIGSIKGIWQKIVLHIVMWLLICWTGAQEIYFHIFKQPLLFGAAVNGAGDALTNYYKEALLGMFQVSPFLLLMLAPGIVATVLLAKGKWVLPVFRGKDLWRTIVLAVAGVLGCLGIILVEQQVMDQDFEAFYEFIDPMTVAERMGVLPLTSRDFSSLFGVGDSSPEDAIVLHTDYDPNASLQANKVEQSVETEKISVEEVDVPEEVEEVPEVVEPAILQHSYEINTDTLYALSEGSKKKTWMADYFTSRIPDASNAYTGMFKGYNLIFLTAEGFSPYAVSEELTPTLYRLIHNGLFFENYYVPLWQTSTSDGEYINCTGLIPDGQFSMRRSSENDMGYTLPGYFAPDGALCMAYHNNSLSYYDRHLSHNNLGYFFKACNLGSLDRSEWGDHLFEMTDPKHWPASDLNMMEATMDEYVNEDYFLTYYMTVSGHMNYNFAGNRQSSRNKEYVADLDMSENARAYKACHVELEKAMKYMLEKLEEAGKLENTLIVLSADHYPYAMSDQELEELAGRDVNYAKDKFRNNLILWNPAFEEKPMTISKPCGSMDLLPTILNLMGFDYDSRLYAGRDIFADNEGLVIFNDKSFVTDRVVYKRKEKEIIWITDENGNPLVPEEEQEAYLDYYKNEVNARYTFSSYMIQEDYFRIIKESLINPLPAMPEVQRLPKKIEKVEEPAEEIQDIEGVEETKEEVLVTPEEDSTLDEMQETDEEIETQ